MPGDSFHDYVKELFAGLGRIEIRRMFGGAGGYCGGLMFLLLADDAIYIKADEALKAKLRAEGSGPFVWAPQSGPRKGEKVDLGYWRLPDAALDDPDLAAAWGRKALAVAEAKARAKAPKAKKPSAKTSAKASAKTSAKTPAKKRAAKRKS